VLLAALQRLPVLQRLELVPLAGRQLPVVPRLVPVRVQPVQPGPAGLVAPDLVALGLLLLLAVALPLVPLLVLVPVLLPVLPPGRRVAS
jgi:hypothetical protein